MMKALLNYLINKHPFYTSILLKSGLKEDETKKTACTDGKSIWFNPSYIETLSFRQKETLFVHEVLHIVFKHPLRGMKFPGVPHLTKNIAADHVVNNCLVDEGFEPLPNWYCDRRYKGWDFESVLRDLLQQDEEKKQEQRESSDQDKQESSKEDKDQSSKEDKQDQSLNEDKQESSGEDKEKSPNGDKQESPNGDKQESSGESSDGSSQSEGNGQLVPGEESGKTVYGEIDEPETKEHAEKINEEIEIAIKQAENAAKRCGKMPAGILREIENAKETETDWRELLAQFINEASKNDYSFMRRNLRYSRGNVIMPGLYNEELDKIVLAIDTSCSISFNEVKEMVNELLSILSLYENSNNPELLVIYCDTKAYAETLQIGDEPKPKGGGGTDFRPPFEYIEENGISPIGLVYLTDGKCYSFPDEPAFPVLWGLVRSNPYFKPPFGETFRFATEGGLR